jgi:FlaA1/EpsC-like NDP-sugar epimerase
MLTKRKREHKQNIVLNESDATRNKTSFFRHFFAKNFFAKMVIDIFVFVAIWILLLWLLPRNALFYHISPHQTTVKRLIFTIVTSTIFVILFRILLRNYGKKWAHMSSFSFINILISDTVAGIVYYVLYERLVSTEYPFLLFVAVFGINCVCTLFIRLLYTGIVDYLNITDA